MATKTRKFLAATLGVLAFATASCGASGSSDQAAPVPTTDAPRPIPGPTPTPVPTPTPTVVTDEITFDDELPKTAQYGDIEFTVESAKVTGPDVEDFTSSETGAAAVLDVTAKSAVEAASWSIPYGNLFYLVVGDDEIEPLSTNLTFELEETDPLTQPIAFPVEPGTDLSEATLLIQEAKSDPSERRRPVEIPIGDGDPTEEAAPIALTASPAKIEIHPIGDTAFNEVVSADLVENLGAREDGSPWDGSEGLLRAREGMLFLRVELEGTSINDSMVGCTGPVGGGVYAEDGQASNNGESVSDNTETGTYCEGEPPAQRFVVFMVPADRDSWEINFGNNDASIAGTVVLTRA